ncbi:DUF4411 family protein [Enterobacter kobei]|nr:DUF4411 family protein [Enterobacter kobei]
MFAGKKSAQIREILISESAWEEMTCLFAPSLDVTEKARTDFASQDKADAFLIAHAMTHGFTIITHERPSGGAPKKRIMIPDAAAIHGVKTLTLYEFLPSYASHNFSIK